MKKCNKCGLEKPLELFYKCKTCKDGYRGACIECVSQQKKDKWNNRSEEKRKYDYERQKEYAENNKEIFDKSRKKYAQKDSTKKRQKEYAQKHKERLSKYKAEYHIKNRDKHLKSFAKYRRTSEYKFISRVGKHNHRTKDKNIGILKKEELFNKFEQQNAKCYYCSIELDFNIPRFVHIDHKIPISKGGLNVIDNIVWCCSNCNLKKGVKLAT